MASRSDQWIFGRPENFREVIMANNTMKPELRDTWEKAAPGWAKWEEVFSAGLSETTETLIDMAGIQTGMRVLDIACGAGNQTIQAAKRVGPNGIVVASDISPTMLEHVRKNASNAGLHNIETMERAAESWMRLSRALTQR
jgi:ubiquinone/menaquinone biosynthesis C-methylase UbiE